MINPFVSIVIPCHNEQVNLRKTVFQVVRYGEHNLPRRYEVILVENGSTDKTFDLARELSRIYQPVRAFQIQERSKAAAVRFGMEMANGDYRYMCDCDLSTPIDELTRFLKTVEDGGWDVVIASREHFAADVRTTFQRWLVGRVFQGITTQITGLQYKDTQCGFKLFNAHAAKDIFSRLQCNSMAFDVEALYLAERLGYYVCDIPVVWRHDPDSRVRLIRDSWLMLRDVLRIPKLHGWRSPLYKTKKVPA